jgi:pyruvate kinase
MSNAAANGQHARTKIVATIGPACREEPQLAELVEAGVNVFRLNMAHADLDHHAETVRRVRAVSAKLGVPIGLLVDLAGPKIRVGEIPGGQMDCHAGAGIRFVRGSSTQSANELTCTYAPLVDELSGGDRVMLADGTISLVVEEKQTASILCRVVQPGRLRSRQGLNLPGVKLSVPAMSSTDWAHAAWAAKMGIDFVGLSFVRSPVEVRALREYLRSHDSQALVIAKIEKQEALDHLEEIVEAADGVMVARGDLGVEIDIARMAVVQKQIVAACNNLQRPVIIATQMLDSMQHSSQPTRAEATDVGNAILDGCDACMLSGETAMGEFPVAAVKMMHRIAAVTESLFNERPPAQQLAPRVLSSQAVPQGLKPITWAVVHGAGRIAVQLDVRQVVVATRSGAAALAFSKLRNLVPTVGISDVETTLRRMCLYWGVTPVPGNPAVDSSGLMTQTTEWGQKTGRLKSGDRVVLVAVALSGAGHNIVAVQEVP